jgi:cystathionine beta-lyase
MKVAAWLAAQPAVARLLHPAFPGCPGHELWKRDFRGASGLFSIQLADPQRSGPFVDRLERFGIGYSWGGFESLALPVEPRASRTATDPLPALVRLHIGLEDPDDLIADLEQALQAVS